MNFSNIVLDGKKATLIPMERAHAAALYEVSRDEAIWAHLPVKIKTLADIEALVDTALKARDTGAEYPFAIVEKASGEFVGSTRFLDINLKDRGLEIGWTWIIPRMWGSHFNTECKYLLLKHCFETQKAIRVFFKTDNLNLRSQKAIAKIGGVKEGVLRNHRIRPDGTYRHSVYFSIIDSEWPVVSQKLLGLMGETDGETPKN